MKSLFTKLPALSLATAALLGMGSSPALAQGLHETLRRVGPFERHHADLIRRTHDGHDHAPSAPVRCSQGTRVARSRLRP